MRWKKECHLTMCVDEDVATRAPTPREMDADEAAAAVAAAVERAGREIPEVMTQLDENPGVELSDDVSGKLRALFA